MPEPSEIVIGEDDAATCTCPVHGPDMLPTAVLGTGSDSRSSATRFGEVVTATVATKPAFSTDVSVEKASVMAPEIDVSALGNVSPLSEPRSGELVEGPSYILRKS